MEGGIDEEMMIGLHDRNYRLDIYTNWLSYNRSDKNPTKEDFLKYRGLEVAVLDKIIDEFEINPQAIYERFLAFIYIPDNIFPPDGWTKDKFCKMEGITRQQLDEIIKDCEDD